MATKQVKTVWVAKDGQEFEAEEAAKQHEMTLELQEILHRILVSIDAKPEHALGIAKGLVRHKSLYISILPKVEVSEAPKVGPIQKG